MSDTPRTDAVIADDSGGSDYISNLARIARLMELELNDALARINRMEAVGDKMLEATVDLGFDEFTAFSMAWKSAKEAA